MVCIEHLRISQIHLKAGTDAPLNVTFIRAPSHALLKVDVPLVFRGDDVSPGLKKGSLYYPRTLIFLHSKLCADNFFYSSN